MQTAHNSLTRQRQQQALALSREVRGERLNLGKKVSAPKDVMIEELNLTSNRGSRMFQERQRRVEKFTLESSADSPTVIYREDQVNELSECWPSFRKCYAMQQPYLACDLRQDNMDHTQSQIQSSACQLGGKENLVCLVPGKHSLVTTLKSTVAKKGNPSVLAPGYSGPLKEIPHEKFNITVVPKSYCSPWREALGDNEELLSSLNSQLPQPEEHQPTNYRCFNRAAMPFGGPMQSKRVIPVIGFEALQSESLPGSTLDRMCKRPNFNRAPRGWSTGFIPESNEL